MKTTFQAFYFIAFVKKNIVNDLLHKQIVQGDKSQKKSETSHTIYRPKLL
jgi:hypothetical protein